MKPATTYPAIACLCGRRFLRAEANDYSWVFTFENAASVATDGYWRLIADGRLITSSDDNEQLFGRASPVKATDELLPYLVHCNVKSATVDSETGDLTLFFEGETKLQFLQLSVGYEAWRTVCGGSEAVCTGAGHVIEFSPPAA